jgi:predicted nucleotidyltransferase
MNIIQFLKKTPESRKIFGEREIKIIEKQVNGIPLTQSEKNRLSRDIRVKLKFIKELSRFQEEFELKKAQSINQIINETKERILEHNFRNKVKKIILFGSFLENKLTIKSDIDIGVEFTNITKEQAFNFRKEILGKVSEKVDLQVLNFLPEKIKKSILNNYKILYKKD